MNKQWGRLLLAGAVIGVSAVVGLSAVQGSMVTAVPFAQVERKGGPVQVYGILDKNSIRSLRGYNLVRFDLVEEQTGSRLAVLYDNPATGLPANFPTASHARATGVYDPVQRKFVADNVYTKCPSKYKEEELDVVTRRAIQKWQAAGGDVTTLGGGTR